MKTISFTLVFTLTGLMAYSQIRTTNVHVTSTTSNLSVGSTTTTTHSTNNTTTNTYKPERTDYSNNNSNTYSNNNSYTNNNNYSNNNTSNNSYSNNSNSSSNGYGSYGNYNNSYNNNSYYNNNSNYNSNSNSNSQNSYRATDVNSYGAQIVTEDKTTTGVAKSAYNIPNQFSNYRKNTAIERFFNNNQKTSQTFIINAQVENTLKGTGGTIVKIAPNSFVTADGELVKGDVEFEMKEMYGKSDMIFSNASTVSNDVALVSGGEIYTGATKNGEPLILATDKPMLIEVPAAAGSNEPMQLFNGQPDRNTVNWNLASPNSVTPVLNTNSPTGYSYNFSSNSMNWLNCDQFNRSLSPNTKVTVRLPRQYDSTNTAVFIVFAGQNTVTKFDNYNPYSFTNMNMSSFDTRWYSVPTGSDVTIVAISEINGQFYSSMQRATLMQNHEADLVMSPTTLDEIKTDMEKLP